METVIKPFVFLMVAAIVVTPGGPALAQKSSDCEIERGFESQRV
jgi:hypothetical protein